MEKPSPEKAMQELINVCANVSATKAVHAYIESCLSVLVELVNEKLQHNPRLRAVENEETANH